MEQEKLQLESVKEDLNFLEYPLWNIEGNNTCQKNIQKLVIEKEHGTYTLKSTDGLPNHFDKKVLDYLFHLIFNNERNNKKNEIVTSRYAIARSLFPDKKNLKTHHYERVMTAIKRWFSVRVEFNGVFYQNGHYVSRLFSIIYHVHLDHDTNKLIIKFDEEFLQQQRETSYFKYFNINTFKQIKQPIAARLYEILSKMFLNRREWITDLDKLAEKLTMSKRNNVKNYYPSDVIPCLMRAVKSHNEFAENKISFLYRKENNTCVFTKQPKI